MSAPEALEVTSWDAFPAEALERVVAFVTTDVLALCAVTCVSRAWRDAAERVEPQFAVRLTKMPPAVAQRLTDAGLAALVRRAHGRLEYLDLCGACLVTDASLIVALQQPHALTTFRADIHCRELTASAVVRALEPRRGLMHDVRVGGLKCTSTPYPDEEALRQVCNHVIDELRALLARNWYMPADNKVCQYEDEPCARLCGLGEQCERCPVAMCGEHRKRTFPACFKCGLYTCDQHTGPDGFCDRCFGEDHRFQEADYY